MGLRQSPSVDKDGNPESGTNGMGWFPGYAIDIQTGERLNIIFAEDSWLTQKTEMICCGIQRGKSSLQMTSHSMMASKSTIFRRKLSCWWR